MNTVRSVLCLAFAVWLVAAQPAAAQRVQMASPVAMQPSIAPPATNYPTPGAASPYPTPSLAPAAQPGAYPAGPTGPYPSSTFTSPPGAVAPPSAALSGTIQQPPTTWDPYATPTNAPSPLMQQDPYLSGSGMGAATASVQRFLQHVDLDYQWFAGHNGTSNQQQLGINNIDLSATFAIPIRNIQTPVLITPGFAVHYWEGPVSVLPAVPADPAAADMPPRTYDAYLDFGWNPQMLPWLGAELNFRTGIYSDFSRVTSDSMRFMGKGMGVVTLSPAMKIKGGVWYLDRNRVKLLPAGGICWTPNPDIYFDILFPNPKIGKRLTTWGNTEWWLYGAGNYGGGNWTVKRNTNLGAPTDGTYDRVDYNDIEVAVGLEFKTLRQLNGYFEVGLSCSRELVYDSNSPPAFYPNNTVYLGAGLSY